MSLHQDTLFGFKIFAPCGSLDEGSGGEDAARPIGVSATKRRHCQANLSARAHSLFDASREGDDKSAMVAGRRSKACPFSRKATVLYPNAWLPHQATSIPILVIVNQERMVFSLTGPSAERPGPAGLTEP